MTVAKKKGSEGLCPKVVDGVVNLTGLLTLGSGEGLKYFETGRAQFYALVVFGGVIALIALFLASIGAAYLLPKFFANPFSRNGGFNESRGS